MQSPSIADNEQERVQALHELELLDTQAEERFDRLTRLARQLFNVPIALVSLVDAERQWFKSRQGLDVCETGRDVSFCGHAILGEDIFEIGDASKDPRFADNPLVTGDTQIRFYAGAPLMTSKGYVIGTLCIIDSWPRQLSAAERVALRDLADAVVAEVDRIELQRDSRELISKRSLNGVIARAQAHFIREDDRRQAFDELLTDILGLTGSEYGFIGEVLSTPEGAPYLKTYAITNIAWNEETRAFYTSNAPQGLEFPNLNTLFGAALTSGEPVIANDPYNDPRRGGLPEGHPALNAFLGIPIHHGSQLVAMLGLANKAGGYDQGVIEFLSPLLVTIAQLIVAAQLQQQHEKDEQQLMRLSRVASQTTNGVIITGVDGRVQWVNEGFTRITGYTLNEMQGQKPGEVLQGPQTDPATVAKIRTALMCGKGFEVEVLNYTRDRNAYWIRIQCSPLHDETGALQGFMAIESDITREKQDARRILDSEARLRGLFELSPVGIALNDYETGAFVDLNQALLQPTGYTQKEFCDLSYWDLTPREYEEQEALQLQSMEKNGRYGPYEKEYIRKDGSRYPVLLNGMVVHDITSRKLIWSMVEDISERKRMERMKNEFVSTVSHELRTPLTSISGALGLVVDGGLGKLPEPARQMINIAYNNSQRLNHLINDLLDIEKIAAGKLHFDMQLQPLIPLIEQALDSHRTYGGKEQVALVLDSEPVDPEVRVDSQRLQQVLANLLSNAIKFSPEGGVVCISVKPMPGLVRVTITDQGSGIPEMFRERIFEKFSQADSSDSRQKGGTGLGLAITRELVERMGGTVGFESVEGEGATFWFELPLMNRYHFDPAADTVLPMVSAAPRILVVEDEPYVAEVLATLLSRAGYRVDVAYTGEQALKALEDTQYEALSLDLMLPDISGMEVIRRVREQSQTANLPIVVVSAKMEAGRLAINGDFFDIDWLAKPVDEQRLLQTIDMALGTSKNMQPRVLHVEDDLDLHQVIRAMIGQRYDIELATSLRQARNRITLERFDVIILDIGLPDGSGWDLLPEIRACQPETRVFILSSADITTEQARQVETVLLKSQVSPQALLDALNARIRHQSRRSLT